MGFSSTSTVTKYVYGWGKSKHLPGPPRTKGVWGLCGARGGNAYAERAHGAHMPVCKHCLRRAERQIEVTASNLIPAEEPGGMTWQEVKDFLDHMRTTCMDERQALKLEVRQLRQENTRLKRLVGSATPPDA